MNETDDINFRRLSLSDWKQFETVEIKFHPQLTVLTGANGSGKTTILNLLARHFGWSHVELATPALEKKSRLFRFFTRFFKHPDLNTDAKIGELEYSNSTRGVLTVPDVDAPQYSVGIEQQQPIKGISIPSHRPT